MAKLDNPFLKHIGPAPGQQEPIPDPPDAKPLEQPDLAVVNKVRHELAIRERKLYEGGTK